jgi:hypothetical protein
MNSLPEKEHAEKSTIGSVTNFCNQYQVGPALKRAGAYKQKGVSVIAIILYLISLVYTGKTMFEDMRSPNPFAKGFAKDTVYRFLNQTCVNWQVFLLSIAAKVVAEIDRLTSNDRLSAFIIDDTIFKALYAKKTELVSLVHDNSEKGKNKYKWGFRMLTLCWTDGVSLIPLAFRHLASSKKELIRCGSKPGLDKRSCAYRIRKEALSKSTDIVIALLKAAIKAGIRAKHLLFDAGLAHPITIIKTNALGFHVTTRIKDTTKVHYYVGDEKKTAKEIFKANKKRPGMSRYLLSVKVSLHATEDGVETKLPVRIVYVRNKRKRNEWVGILTTDMTLSEESVIALYGKRWDIEVFFKVCKSYLKLAKELQQLSYDAITAHTTIVMIRYIILSVEKRIKEDPRSLGNIFFVSFDELADKKFEQVIFMIMDILFKAISDEILGLTEEQIDGIIDIFMQELPEDLRPNLLPKIVS